MDLNYKLADRNLGDVLSVRAINCCYNHNIYTVGDLLRFYVKGGSVLPFRNAGVKTETELKRFFLQNKHLLLAPTSNQGIDYGDKLRGSSDIDTIPINSTSGIFALQDNIFIAGYHDIVKMENSIVYANDLLSGIDNARKILFQNSYNQWIDNYSARGFATICETLTLLGHEDFIRHYLFVTNKKLLNLVGEGTADYDILLEFKEIYKSEFYEILCQNRHRQPKEHELISHLSPAEKQVALGFYEKHHHFPMLWILEKSIRKINNRTLQVINSTLPMFTSYDKRPIRDIAAGFDLTPVRIRQIRDSFMSLLTTVKHRTISHEKTDFHALVKILRSRYEWGYFLDLMTKNETFGELSPDLVYQLETEQATFTPAFCLQVIGRVYPEKFRIYH